MVVAAPESPPSAGVYNRPSGLTPILPQGGGGEGWTRRPAVLEPGYGPVRLMMSGAALRTANCERNLGSAGADGAAVAEFDDIRKNESCHICSRYGVDCLVLVLV